ncbi:MAG: NRDE family protein [Myxococcota bacterium]
MCTIILAHNVVDGAPVFLGSNRDEQLGRPAAPPKEFNDRALRVVAPQDLEAGGTWLGINEAGVLVAITNRFGAFFGSDRRSRGELVFKALEYDTPHAAAEAIGALDATDYNGFHLVIASPEQARLVWGDGELMCRSELPSGGISVVTERSLGAARNDRKRRVKREVEELARHHELDGPALEQLLSKRDDGSMDATCVVMDGLDYGTRSSTIVGLGGRPLLRYADGRPCDTPFEDRSDLLVELFG